jgi:hypothetical protein
MQSLLRNRKRRCLAQGPVKDDHRCLLLVGLSWSKQLPVVQLPLTLAAVATRTALKGEVATKLQRLVETKAVTSLVVGTHFTDLVRIPRLGQMALLLNERLAFAL